MKPVLSILIPSLPERLTIAHRLFDHLRIQSAGLPVEILMLTDNRIRKAGGKREALVQLATGSYVAFVDDDDRVADDYVESIVTTILDHHCDVVVFDSFCIINEGPVVRVRHGMQHENEQYNPAGFCRKPWHIHAWRAELAKSEHFEDVNGNEDWPWCEKLLRKAKTQAVASDHPLYTYIFNSKTTEASK